MKKVTYQISRENMTYLGHGAGKTYDRLGKKKVGSQFHFFFF